MVINATFNNISVISWLSVLLMEETGVPGETDKLYHIMEQERKWMQMSMRYLSTLQIDTS